MTLQNNDPCDPSQLKQLLQSSPICDMQTIYPLVSIISSFDNITISSQVLFCQQWDYILILMFFIRPFASLYTDRTSFHAFHHLWVVSAGKLPHFHVAPDFRFCILGPVLLFCMTFIACAVQIKLKLESCDPISITSLILSSKIHWASPSARCQ